MRPIANSAALRPPVPAPPENAVRWLDVDLPEQGFGFGVIHILTAIPGAKEPDGAAKTRFWDALLAAAEARIDEPLLFIGDFNTGTPLADEAGTTFVCAEHFARLPALGWIDVWRHFHGDATEYTWYSLPRGGARQRFPHRPRLRHASLLPRITACRYSHAEREQKSPIILP